MVYRTESATGRGAGPGEAQRTDAEVGQVQRHGAGTLEAQNRNLDSILKNIIAQNKFFKILI